MSIKIFQILIAQHKTQPCLEIDFQSAKECGRKACDDNFEEQVEKPTKLYQIFIMFPKG